MKRTWILALCLAGCASYQNVGVESTPPGAEIFLDGKSVGQTPLELRIPKRSLKRSESVEQMLRTQIGETAFDRFLHDHYAKHRYGYITSADLLADAQGACGCDIQPLFTAWITTVAPVEAP